MIDDVMVSTSLAGRPKRVLLVGLGKRSTDDHLPTLDRMRTEFALVAICDIDPGARARYDELRADGDGMPRVPVFTDLRRAVAEVAPDLALVSTPHHTHLEIADTLAGLGVPFLKEKPFARSPDEARRLAAILERGGSSMGLLVQRRFHRTFVEAKRQLGVIGPVRHFRANYCINATDYATGSWRSDLVHSGGGAIIDLGYHTLDLLDWYFGQPEIVYAAQARPLRSGPGKGIEESVMATFRYRSGLIGSLFVSLCEPSKSELVCIAGAEGEAVLDRSHFTTIDRTGHRAVRASSNPSWDHSMSAMYRGLVEAFDSPSALRAEVERGVRVCETAGAVYRAIVTGEATTVRDEIVAQTGDVQHVGS